MPAVRVSASRGPPPRCDHGLQWGYRLAEQRKRLGFTQAGLAEIGGHLLKMPASPAG